MLAAVGRALIAAGVVVLLFAGYQLWGTGLSEARAQDDLADEFTRRLESLPASADPGVAAPGTTAPVGDPNGDLAGDRTLEDLVELVRPRPGGPVARLLIPRIGLDKVVVEGVEDEFLRTGPGHFPDTPLPGQTGNAAIAGHRTTYGAPFYDLDLLQPGDEIRVRTVLGDATYRVAGTKIVSPDQIDVVGDLGDNRLTLSACHPKYSAAQRIIVWATLESRPLPAIGSPGSPAGPSTTSPAGPAPTSPAPAGAVTTTTAPTDPGDGGPGGDGPGADLLTGDSSAWPGTISWSLATLFTAAATWTIAVQVERRRGERRAWRRWTIYALGSPVVLACLFVCFTFVERLLPQY